MICATFKSSAKGESSLRPAPVCSILFFERAPTTFEERVNQEELDIQQLNARSSLTLHLLRGG